MSIRINYIDEEKLKNHSAVEFGFRLDSEYPSRLVFKIYDPLFEIQYIPGEHTVDAYPGIDYFVRFEIDVKAKEEKPNCMFGFILICEDELGNVLFREEHFNLIKAERLRPRDNDKVLWIIGDSNVWASFGNDEFKYEDIGGYKPVRISVTSLSLNRFLKGKNTEFMLGLPIKDNDVISFYLGEIDFRYTIHKYVLSKNKNLIDSCNDLMDRYFSTLIKIKDYFPNNRIIVMSPNPPIPDGFHSDIEMVKGSEQDRKECLNIFDKFWKSQNTFEYLNWTEKYKDNNGLINTNFLYDGNHHIKNHETIKAELDKKIQNINMEINKIDNSNIDPKELVDYCLNADLMEKCVFMQVYEEILTLSYWLKGFQPRNILEIGTMGSTFWIMSKLSTGKKVSLDIEPRESIIHHFMYGEDWKFFRGDSHTEEIFQKVKDFCPQFDFIFIDGDHTYEGVKKDFEMYKNLLSPRGVIGFHDIDPDHIFADSYAGQVYKFWQDLEEGTKMNLVCKKSSGKVKLNGIHKQGFGGIGLWRP